MTEIERRDIEADAPVVERQIHGETLTLNLGMIGINSAALRSLKGRKMLLHLIDHYLQTHNFVNFRYLWVIFTI